MIKTVVQVRACFVKGDKKHSFGESWNSDPVSLASPPPSTHTVKPRLFELFCSPVSSYDTPFLCQHTSDMLVQISATDWRMESSHLLKTPHPPPHVCRHFGFRRNVWLSTGKSTKANGSLQEDAQRCEPIFERQYFIILFCIM